MATKLQSITELSRQTAIELTQTRDTWRAFLKAAAWNYKYPFQDQVLIFAQKPDATACASIEFWNAKLGRWVNKGAKGIALIDDSGGRHTLRHVFDVSDTNSRNDRPVLLWSMQDRYAEATIEALGNAFGELEHADTLPVALLSAVENAVEDNASDYLAALLNNRQDSFLEYVDDAQAEAHFRKSLRASVAYMVLVRCGYDPDEHVQDAEFLAITDFNTLDTIARLGAAVSDISEMLLREIESTVRSQQRVDERERRTFAKTHELQHTEYRDQQERTDEHGAELHAEGRLPSSRPDAARGTAHRQVWDVAQDVPQGTRPGAVRQPHALGQADGAPRGDRSDGTRAGGAIDGEAAGAGAGPGQGNRPDGLGAAHEQHEASGGGTGAGGADLQLSPLPTVEEQISAIEQAEVEKTSAFSIPQGDIDRVLQRGSGFTDSKYRIAEQFAKNVSNKENADFLKKEYGTGGQYPAAFGVDLDEGHNAKGVTLRRNFHDPAALLLPWSKVAKRIGELIAADRYLSPREKEHFPVYGQEQEERRQRAAEEAYAREILSHTPVETPSRENVQYAIPLGSMVHLGADEYAVFSLGNERVTLQDVRFPLLTRDLTRVEFERLLRENPLNDHLIDTAASAAQSAEKEAITLHADDPGAPDWVRKTGDVVLSLDGDTVTIDNAGGGEHGYVELDIDIPEPEPAIASAEPATFEPVWEKKPGGEVAHVRIDLIPSAPAQKRIDYHNTDDNLGQGGQKAKYAANVAAIRLLKRLEAEDRLADADEQEILSRYVGWGGLPQAFDEANSQWAKECAELKELLDGEEYELARGSTLNAHYTSPTVIKAMYTCLENMGFKTGNVLEPACGIGNFFGLVPESMKDSRLYGVELDSITGRIAKQLYQNANIAVQGFEATNLPDSFFDLAIGNVPFGGYGVADKRYDKHKFLIHDYFFAKTLDKVRPGGIIAFITSKGTLDKQSPEVRKYIAHRCGR